MQVIFIRDGKVVCYCNGSGKSNGYFISVHFESDWDYRVFYHKDDRILFFFEGTDYLLFEEQYDKEYYRNDHG